MKAILSRLTALVLRLLFRRRRVASGKQHSPIIADYEQVGLVWRPYVMRLSRPNQITPSVQTDDVGFRVSYFKGAVFSFQQYRSSEDASVLLGNSVAFGVGASNDTCSLASQLAEIANQPWICLAGRASNLMQDVLTFVLYGAHQNRDIVLMSGINDLLFALTFESASPWLPSFWGEDLFVDLNKRDRPNMVWPDPDMPVEKRYLIALQGIDRALLLLSRYGRQKQNRILFALQPVLSWIDKPLHQREKEVCEEWDLASSGFRATHKPAIIRPWRKRFSSDIRSICKAHELDFIDLNDDPAWLTEEHLFVDRIHLTDRGQLIAAKLIWKRLCAS
ncbi:hypothetical protein [Methylophilus sp. Leaf414]|uniref:hypothetical protein n=1 Tax=Methylophilus sp. Leaf414 TaxID=1736371 RepID=UPI000712EA85|nr:hypothetical protein [Methylophilus sp. Leaf414]KQT34353.1 hypothetical protein ASG24_11550 [Methylophilus sp. Leaf414]